MRLLYLVVITLSISMIVGCPFPAPRHSPPPGQIKKAKPKPVPPGQVRRQQTPSGPKPIPPGQRKKMAPAPAAVILAPPLPPFVEIEIGIPYPYEGYYYFYDGGSWFYADSPHGKKMNLPKSHHPKKFKVKKGKGNGKGKGKHK